MNSDTMQNFTPVKRSLTDLLGSDYMDSVCAAHSFFHPESTGAAATMAGQEIDFYPQEMQARLTSLLNQVGNTVTESPLAATAPGASTLKFNEATKTDASPLAGYGYYRLGEDGRLYLMSKSEHYHAPLGHSFPGYALIDRARALGIPNATHNNTRGYITRRLEEELVRTANGIARDDRTGLSEVLDRTGDLYVLNRVLNLETGSLAVEAALKMVLSRFYRIQPEMPKPKYEGCIPVLLVMGNDDGGFSANYHGTTILPQMMRGMWPHLYNSMETSELWKVVPIRPNNRDDLEKAFATYEQGPYKIAGFFHEIIMMNYGGRRLTPQFLQYAHELCRRHDVVTVVDEIQSCMWSSELFLFREYGLKPTFVAVGKGFPGGEYPASRILFSSEMDTMPQFGALVTNGQEELASLAYLITMEWAQENAAATRAVGTYCEEQITSFAEKHPQMIEKTDGWNHMTTIVFSDLGKAKAFTTELGRRGIDISAQTYKEDCPPVVLLKLPITADKAMIDYIAAQMEAVATSLA